MAQVSEWNSIIIDGKPGMNIFSGSRDGDGLAATLTNPTVLSWRKGTIKQAYPVHFAGCEWPDAETAYLTLARETSAWSRGSLDDLMADIIAAKFAQHPELAAQVQELGGVAFLETCKHLTGAKSQRFRAWEGFDRNSRFIRNLIAAFERWQQTTPTIAQDALQGPSNPSARPEHGKHV